MKSVPAAWRKNMFIGLLLFGAVAVAYSDVWHNQFLFDDEFLLQKNTLIRSWRNFFKIFLSNSTGGAGGADSFYRPMQTLAYLVTYQIAGLSEPAFHLLNLLLHIANAALIYLLSRLLRLNGWWAVLPALLWAVHPIHTEAVTYMSATADPLHTLFCLLSCWWFLRFTGKKKIIGSLTAFILALLSKEPAVVLPVLILAVGYFHGVQEHPELTVKRQIRRAFKLSLPFWAVVAVYLISRMTVLDFDDTFKFYRQPNIYTEHVLYRIYTFWATLPNYFQLLLFPHDLHMERNFPVYTEFFSLPVVGGALLFFSMLGGLIWGLMKNVAWAVFVPLWFLGAHIPQMGVLLPVNALFLEHWMYLPSIALFWGLAAGGQRLSEKFSKLPRFAAGLGFTVAIIWGAGTFRQNKTWSDPITFYNYILDHEQGNLRIHNNLGMAYSDRGQYTAAIRHYEKAIGLAPDSPNPRHNLGLIYLRQGRLDQGIAALQEAVRIDPNFYHSYLYLARTYAALGDSGKAEEYARKYREARAKFP